MKQHTISSMLATAFTTAATGLFLTGQSASANIVGYTGASQDSTVWQRAGNAGFENHEAGAYDQVDFYSFSSGGDINAFGYFQFDLSSLVGVTFNSVSLSLTQVDTNNDYEGFGGHSTRNDVLTTDRVALYGLADVAGNTPQNWTEGLAYSATGSEMDQAGNANFATDPFDVANGRAVDFSTLESVAGGVITLSDPSVTAFVQSRVDDDGYVTFLLDFDATGRGAAVYSSEAATGQPILLLDFEPIPEPSAAVLGGLGLLALFIRRRRA